MSNQNNLLAAGAVAAAAGVVALLKWMKVIGSLPPIKKDVEIRSLNFLYREVQGPYPESCETFKSMYDLFKSTPMESAGLFFDNPKDVEAKKCRSELGMLLPQEMADDAAFIRRMTEEHGFKLKRIPALRAAVVDFPVRVSFSYMIGPMRVWRMLLKEVPPSTDSVMEIYTDKSHKDGKLIRFVVPNAGSEGFRSTWTAV